MVQEEHWKKLSLAEQMGNIGSEFHRWQNTKSDKSFEEVLSLLDLTIADKRWSQKLRELTRLREVICDIAQGAKLYDANPETLDQYFLDFGMIARK